MCFKETSAKTADGVSEMVAQLAQEIINKGLIVNSQDKCTIKLTKESQEMGKEESTCCS